MIAPGIKCYGTVFNVGCLSDLKCSLLFFGQEAVSSMNEIFHRFAPQNEAIDARSQIPSTIDAFVK